MTNVTSKDNIDDVTEEWPLPDAIPLYDGTEPYRFLTVLASELQRLDIEIEEVYDDRFLQTASGEELDKIAALVEATRKSNESDQKFRKRIQAIFTARASDTTYDSVASLVLMLLDADASTITINRPPTTADTQITVDAPSTVVDDSIFTESEITSLIEDALPAGHSATITKSGTFAFAGDDSNLEGWNEGTWSTSV